MCEATHAADTSCCLPACLAAAHRHLLTLPLLLACRLAALLEEQGFMPARQWLAAWEAEWQRNLDTCDAEGRCLIQVT